jgi:uncharacterized OB-fold protein
MEVRPGPWAKPLPGPDGVSSPYWAGVAGGRLLVQRCPECGKRQFYPRALCIACGGTPEFEEASGSGSVHTFTVIRQNGLPPFTSELPYVVAMVDLDEGPRVMGNVTGCPPEDVYIGMRLRAYGVEAEPGVAIPQWEPDPGPATWG